MSEEDKVLRASIGDVEFDIVDLTNFTMSVLDCVIAVATLMNPEISIAIREQLLGRADVEDEKGNTGTAALLRAATNRISPSGSWPDQEVAD